MRRPVAVLLALAALGGCAHSQSGSVYSRDQAEREQSVRMGTVDAIREVTIEGTRTPIGTMTGAVVGGVAGSNVGGGKGSSVAAVIATVVGGVAGAAVEEAATRKPGIEITVKLDSGSSVAIVQEADESFKPGDRVRIVSSGSSSRVAH